VKAKVCTTTSSRRENLTWPLWLSAHIIEEAKTAQKKMLARIAVFTPCVSHCFEVNLCRLLLQHRWLMLGSRKSSQPL